MRLSKRLISTSRKSSTIILCEIHPFSSHTRYLESNLVVLGQGDGKALSVCMGDGDADLRYTNLLGSRSSLAVKLYFMLAKYVGRNGWRVETYVDNRSTILIV